MTPDVATVAVALWWARVGPASGPGAPAGTRLVGVLSGEFPAGTVVHLPGSGRPSGWQVAVTSGASGVHAVEVAAPGAPLLWYVELPEPAAAPAATTLVAFSDRRHPEGRLLSVDEGRRCRATGDQQVGALRWWPAYGLVHQLYVAPAHRRRGVARKLVTAAFGIQAARGLPALHGDGRRTELGEQWRRGLPEAIAERLAPWEEHLPAM